MAATSEPPRDLGVSDTDGNRKLGLSLASHGPSCLWLSSSLPTSQDTVSPLTTCVQGWAQAGARNQSSALPPTGSASPVLHLKPLRLSEAEKAAYPPRPLACWWLNTGLSPSPTPPAPLHHLSPSCPSVPESLQVTPSMGHSTFPYPCHKVRPCSGLMAMSPQLPLRGLCCHLLIGAALGPEAPPRWEPAHPHVLGDGTATGSLFLSLTLPVSLSSPTPCVSTFPHWPCRSLSHRGSSLLAQTTPPRPLL